MAFEIVTYFLMVALLIESIIALRFLLKKKPKKPCFGEWGFEGDNNCELCRDDEECTNCSN